MCGEALWRGPWWVLGLFWQYLWCLINKVTKNETVVPLAPSLTVCLSLLFFWCYFTWKHLKLVSESSMRQYWGYHIFLEAQNSFKAIGQMWPVIRHSEPTATPSRGKELTSELMWSVTMTTCRQGTHFLWGPQSVPPSCSSQTTSTWFWPTSRTSFCLFQLFCCNLIKLYTRGASGSGGRLSTDQKVCIPGFFCQLALGETVNPK